MMDVDTMEAGPEMDKMVADLMGWDPADRAEVSFVSASGDRFSADYPRYSSDIKAAMSVVEAHEDNDQYEPEVFEFRGPFPGGAWHVRIVWRHHDGDIPMVDWFIADSLPLGICQAALKRDASD